MMMGREGKGKGKGPRETARACVEKNEWEYSVPGALGLGIRSVWLFFFFVFLAFLVFSFFLGMGWEGDAAQTEGPRACVQVAVCSLQCDEV